MGILTTKNCGFWVDLPPKTTSPPYLASNLFLLSLSLISLRWPVAHLKYKDTNIKHTEEEEEGRERARGEMKSHMVWFLFLASFLSVFPAPSESMVRHYKFNVSLYISTCIFCIRLYMQLPCLILCCISNSRNRSTYEHS